MQLGEILFGALFFLQRVETPLGAQTESLCSAARGFDYCQRMSEQWVVRVDGREYGPADFDTLREWKREGCVLPANQARRADSDLWVTAAEIPGLFIATSSEAVASTVQAPPSPGHGQPDRGFADILIEAWQIYRKGFWPCLCLSALVAVPSICVQLTSAAVGVTSTKAISFPVMMAAAFNLCMFLVVLAAWPVFIAGIQLLTAELAAGRTIGVSQLFQRSLRFWPRIAFLCIVVYGVFFLLMLFALMILLMTAFGAGSVSLIFLALVLLVLQVWMFGRWFINVLFWQQFAVLEGSEPITALRQSKELARSGRDLPWFQRPSWRGAFIASIWFALALGISVASEWTLLGQYFSQLGAHDPKALLQILAESAKSQDSNFIRLALNSVQTVLRPLLGIAFVLLFFQSRKSD